MEAIAINPEQIIWPLILAGVLAGIVNFFINYVHLPLASDGEALSDEKKALKDYVGIALLGYIFIGIAGAWLTPVINSLVELQGLQPIDPPPTQSPGDTPADPRPKLKYNPFYIYILFGWGLVFGYSANKLLGGILGIILKRFSKLEKNLTETGHFETRQELNVPSFRIEVKRTDITKCEGNLTYYKDNVKQFTTPCWEKASNLIDAKTYTNCTAEKMVTKNYKAIYLPDDQTGKNGIFIHQGSKPADSDGCIVCDKSKVLQIYNDTNHYSGGKKYPITIVVSQ